MGYKILAITLTTLALAGCWNGENVHISWGDVSLGQQLIDLKSALDNDALTPAEYEATKETLLTLNSLCKNTESDDSWL